MHVRAYTVHAVHVQPTAVCAQLGLKFINLQPRNERVKRAHSLYIYKYKKQLQKIKKVGMEYQKAYKQA